MKFINTLKYGGLLFALLMGSGIDYPPAPDGVSWWNLWLVFVGLGITIFAAIMQRRLTSRRYIRKRLEHTHAVCRRLDFKVRS